MQVFDLQFFAGAAERRADRAAVVRKDKVAPRPEPALFLDEMQGIETGQIEQRNELIVADLLAWVLAIVHDDHAASGVDFVPMDAADFLLTHRAGDGEAHDPPHRHQQPPVCIEIVQ